MKMIIIIIIIVKPKVKHIIIKTPPEPRRIDSTSRRPLSDRLPAAFVGIHYRGVQSEGGAVDGGSSI